MSERTFTAKQVCAALEVPHGTLNSWAHAGWLKSLDAAETTPGKARKYTVRDIFTLAILKILLRFGLSGTQAALWASVSVAEMEEGRRSELTIAVSAGTENVIFLNPDESRYTVISPGLKFVSKALIDGANKDDDLFFESEYLKPPLEAAGARFFDKEFEDEIEHHIENLPQRSPVGLELVIYPWAIIDEAKRRLKLTDQQDAWWNQSAARVDPNRALKDPGEEH